MKIKYHIYKDFHVKDLGSSDEEIADALQPGSDAISKRYSLVCGVHHKGRNKLYLGATNTAGDLLLSFDLETSEFKSLGLGDRGLLSKHDVKIHKGLTLNEGEDALYFATASLDSISRIIDSDGGSLIRCDLKSGELELLGRPVPGDFFQSSCWDFKNQLAYLFTSRLCFAVFDIKERKLLRYESMESIPHNSCLDDHDRVWGTHSAGSHKFYRFNPDGRKFEFPDLAFPNADASANIQYPGAGPVDCMINGGDGYLYTTNALGELYRLDPVHDKIEYLGKPFPKRRVPALAMGEDGWLYLCGGHRPISLLSRYHIAEKRFEYLGEIRHEDGTWLEYAHEIVVVGNRVFAVETDNMIRNGYLWECVL